ncbi:MAG: hypothetical protein QOK05_1196 [Chloroflexota bacterium]|jgi:molybdopterin-binding protein|nr:hypothetical protein [Chloroflexota bacterium]
MRGYTVNQAAELLGVSDDTVRRWADAGKLGPAARPGARRLIDPGALAALALTMATPATALPAASQSARNRFPGIVTRVVKDLVMAQVEVQAGPHRVVSLISREAVEELGLEPGVLVVAAVKATNVVVERPAAH